MLTIHDIREIIKLMDQTDVEVLEVQNEETRLLLKKAPQQAASYAYVPNLTGSTGSHAPIAPVSSAVSVAPISVSPVPDIQVKSQVFVAAAKQAQPTAKPSSPTPSVQMEQNDQLLKIVSPMVGTFYQAPAIDADPYVKIGDQVEKTTVVCIVEAMKLFNEIEADVKGEVVQVLVENGQLVEQGQPLFLIKESLS